MTEETIPLEICLKCVKAILVNHYGKIVTSYNCGNPKCNEELEKFSEKYGWESNKNVIQYVCKFNEEDLIKEKAKEEAEKRG